MKKTLFIIGFIVALLVVILLYLKSNVQNNITGEVEKFSVIRFYDILAPKVDINVQFKVVNNSEISFNVSDFKIKIFDVDTNTFLTENVLVQTLHIPIGVSYHDTQLLGNEILGNASELLNSSGKTIRVEVEFKAFLVDIKFEELITI